MVDATRSILCNPVIVIPARLDAQRLPGKPLARIHGHPMIHHVWMRAQESGLGPVWVAASDRLIATSIEESGGQAVLTDPELPSGTDRVAVAIEQIDPEGKHDLVINVQGDMPWFDSSILAALPPLFVDVRVDMATLVTPIRNEAEAARESVVKCAFAPHSDGGGRSGRALYFSRAPIPHGSAVRYRHIGIYAFRRAALRRFVALAPCMLEQSEKLEQLRALAACMRIDVAVVDASPVTVDTHEDLAHARKFPGRDGP